MNYGKLWQKQKQAMMSKFSKTAITAYRPAQHRALRILLKNLLDDPDSFMEHLRLYSGQLIIDVTYGIPILSRDHKLIKTAEAVMHSIGVALSPVFSVFNLTPLLQVLPHWLGGGRFLDLVQKWQSDARALHEVPFDMVKAFMDSGTARPSYASSLLENLKPQASSDEESVVRDTSAVAYGAGADTSLAAVSVFFLVMLQNPKVQKMAQDELDRVIKSSRLPDHTDQPELPYITAVMKETLRWHAATPLGIAHMLTTDDEYRGWHLPAGSLIVPNVWGMLQDPKTYDSPAEFRPERFLRDGKLDCPADKDPARILFGFGRRVCVGRHFVQDAMFLLIAQVLSVFTISTIDSGPPPKVDMTSGGVSMPMPHKCLIRPRSEIAKRVLEDNILSADDV